MQTRHHGSPTRFVIGSLVAMILTANTVSPVYAEWHGYAGENSANSTTADGIDGYIRLSVTGTLGPGQSHADWIGLCVPVQNCGDQNLRSWVQLGELQTTPNQVYVYREFTDACGRWQQPQTWGLAPANQAYYVYRIAGGYSEQCPPDTRNHGQNVFEYPYVFARGSVTNTFATGFMSATAGQYMAKTEIQPDQSVPLGYDFFGCSGLNTCSSPGYGIHYHDSNGWNMWMGNVTTEANNPPDFQPKSYAWAFETCPMSGCI